MAIGLTAGLGLAALTAAIHEEFFFRAVLQSRLTAAMGSSAGGLATTTLIFSLYHLPFKLFAPGATGWETALASALADSIFGGLVLGVLWQRTRNLLAPVLVHAWIDALAGRPSIGAALGL